MKKLKYTLQSTFTLFFLFSMCQFSYSQLGQTWSSYYEKGFAFNPALTAYWDNLEFTASHRKEWTQFDGAPVNTSIGAQIPILSKDISRSSLGVYLDKDKAGPLNSVGTKLTYAYRIVPNLLGYKNDQLKIGIGVNARTNRFDPSSVIAFESLQDDALNFTQESRYSVSGSVGIFYVSTDNTKEYTSHYFWGLSLNNLSPTKSTIEGLGEVTQNQFATLHLGMRYHPRRSVYYLEPSVFTSYTFDKELLVMLNLRYEYKNRFYAAVGGDTNGGIFGQAGVVVSFKNDCRSRKGYNSNSPYNDYTDLRIGVKVGNRFGPLSQFIGTNYEFLVAYNLACCD